MICALYTMKPTFYTMRVTVYTIEEESKQLGSIFIL